MINKEKKLLLLANDILIAPISLRSFNEFVRQVRVVLYTLQELSQFKLYESLSMSFHKLMLDYNYLDKNSSIDRHVYLIKMRKFSEDLFENIHENYSDDGSPIHRQT
jgi:hypothetical protein